MKNLIRVPAKLLTLIPAIIGIVAPFHAKANMWWDPNNTGVGTTANGTWENVAWTTTATPVASGSLVHFVEGAFVVFSVTGDGATSANVTVGANHTFAGLFNGGTGAATACANLTIGGPGILSVASGAQGLNCGGNLIFTCPLGGVGPIQPSGSAGQLYLRDTNTFTGGMNYANTTLVNFNNGGSFGSTGPLTISVNGGAWISEGTAAITIPNPIVISVNSAINLVANAGHVTYSGNVNLNTFNWCPGNNSAATGGMDIFSGIISGSGSFGRQTNSAHNAIKLTGANTYTGRTYIPCSTNIILSLNSVTTPAQQASSSLGKPSSVANGTIAFGSAAITGALQYLGTGETTDRVIDLAGTTGGANLQSDGTGPIVFTSDFTATGAGAKTLTLQGANTGANTISGKIVNSTSATSVAKSGAGTWVLSGVNAFTGPCTLNAGTLDIGSSTALGAGAFTIGGNGTFDNTSAGVLTMANAITMNGGSPTFTGTRSMSFNGAALVSGANRTLTVSASTLTLNGVLSGTVQFTKAGAGKLVINNAAALSGSTVVSGGTLALGASGSLTASPQLTLAPNTTFDVSAIPSYTLGNTLVASGTTGAATIIGGTGIALNSQAIFLSISPASTNGDLTHPALNISQSDFALNGNNITVSNLSGVALGVGTYPVLVVSDGTLSGSVGTFTLKGTAVTSGKTASLVQNGNELDLVVKEVPVFSNLTSTSVALNGTVILSGTLSGASAIYPANGEAVSVTISGNTQNTTINDATGDFSINYDTTGIASGTYPVTYAYAGDTSLLATTNAATSLTITVPPVAGTATPANPTNNAGTTVVLSVSSTGGSLNYQWQKGAANLSNGSNPNAATVSGSTTANLTLAGVYTADIGNYTCIVTNLSGSDTSSTAVLTVIDPVINTQPIATLDTNAGSTVTLTVAAVGSTNLTYQWQKNGVDMDSSLVPSATNATLTLTSVVAIDAASYSVAVTNALGSGLISSNTVLTVVDPYIATQPVSLTNNAGTPASFAVTVFGTATVSYQWSLNGTVIPTATDATYSIASAADADAGTYQCAITNGNSVGVLSDAVTFTVIDAPVVSNPDSQTVGAGTNVIFMAPQTSGSASAYQWFKGAVALSNNGHINGSTTTSLTVTGADDVDVDVYSLVASNAAATVTTLGASLAVVHAPVFITGPDNILIAFGASSNITASASGSSASYQWYKGATPLSNGGHITGAQASVLQFANVDQNDIGSYSLVLSNLAGTATSAPGFVDVVTAPKIDQQPLSVTVSSVSNAVFSVTAVGAPVLTYQWKRNGSGLLDDTGYVLGTTTNNVLTLHNLDEAADGTYTVTVHNGSGDIDSDGTAILTVIVAPSVATNPTNAIVGLGSNAVFNASFNGTAPAYQWYSVAAGVTNLLSEGSKYTGVTSPSLTVIGSDHTDEVSYHAGATNFAGTIVGSDATLTVIDPAVISPALANVVVGAGTNAIFTATVTGTSPVYSWSKAGTGVLSNGAHIAGSTSASLTIIGSASSDNGTYTLTASNIAAVATSSATLTVNDQPVITGAPSGGGTFNATDSTTLSVSVTGSATLAYQWKKNGTNLPSATLATLALNSMTYLDSGSYNVIVTNSAGSATSAATTVNVLQGPSILVQPVTQSPDLGASATFSVTAAGNPLNYQWSLNGVAISGATDSALNIASAQSTNIGQYVVVISNGQGSVTSTPADLVIPAFYSDALDANTASSWTTNSSGVNRLTWAYDYSVDSVPQNPFATNAKALKLEANYTGVGSVASISLSPAGQSFTGDYQLRYDVWLNAMGPFPWTSGPVYSQSTIAGVGTTGTSVQMANNSVASGVWFQANNDGAFPFNTAGNYPDFSAYINTALQRTNTGIFAAGNGALATDNSNPYYASTFPSRTAPAGQTTAFPTVQTGSTDPGSMAFAWHQVIVKKVANVITWSIDGLRIASVTNATLPGNNVMIGYLDPNASIAPATAVAFGLYSNFRVEMIGAENGTGVTINSQPATQTVGINSAATLSVGATGLGTLLYQWQENGTNISGATSSSLSFTNLQFSDAGSYSVHIQNQTGYTNSDVAVLTVADPGFALQPQNVSAECGSATSLTVAASGTSAIHYQWYKNVSTPVGTDSTTLSFNPAHLADSGTYTVVITDLNGSTTSSAAVLSVTDTIAPVVTVVTVNPQTIQCHTAFIDDGATAADTCGGDLSGSIVNTGSVNVNTPGVYTLTYSATDASGNTGSATRVVTVIDTLAPAITLNGNNPQIVVVQQAYVEAGATASDTCAGNVTGSILTTGTVDTNTLGSYTITYTVADGNGNTGVAYRTVNVTPFGPTISGLSPSQAVNAGTDLVLSVTNSGQTPYTYFWLRDGTNVSGSQYIGASTASLTVTNIIRTNAGTFSVIITNNSGAITSAPIVITVNDPVITTQPVSISINKGQTNVFSVAAAGTQPIKYQWYTVKTNSAVLVYTKVTGQTNAAYTLVFNAQPSNGYAASVSNLFGMVTSSVAHVIFFVPPAITTQPVNTNGPVGKTFTLSLGASGTAPLAYQWYHNGDILSLQTTNKLTVTNAQVTDSGSYSCVVTNGGGMTNTMAIKGIVNITNVPVKITTSPANFTRVAGTNVTFTVAATGTAPLHYQWKENGHEIGGANGTSLALINVQEIGSNFYSCVVTNPAGPLESPTNVAGVLHGLLWVKADTNKPSVSITYPASGARLTNMVSYTNGGLAQIAPFFTLAGSASDNGLITNITIQRTFPTVDDSVTAIRTQTLPGSAKFTNMLSFKDGTNTYVVTVWDSAGNSNTTTRTFFYVNNTTMLAVTNVGYGTNFPVAIEGLSPHFSFKYGAATNGALLEIGRSYKVTAGAMGNNIFTNWTDGNGAVLTNGVSLLFRMSSNLVLNANFLTNPIVAGGANGKYNGLFSEGTNLTIETAGSLTSVSVGTNRSFSGSLNLQGKTYTIATNFDVSGDRTFTVKRTTTTLTRASLTVTLHLDWSGATRQITGTILSTNDDLRVWTSSVVADMAIYNTNSISNYPTPLRYTAAIAPVSVDGMITPAGSGYVGITNTLAGLSSLSGKLADGTSISLSSMPISKDGNIPVSIRLYTNSIGLLQGWFHYTSTNVSADVTWIRPANNLPATYVQGFTNVTTVTGTPYLKPVTGTVFGSNTNLILELFDTEGFATNRSGSLLIWNVQLKGNNFVIVPAGSATNKFNAPAINTSQVNTTDGSINISYKTTSGLNKTLNGMIDQVNTNASGYLIGTTNVGSFSLHP